jgi:hypothetical protein
VGESESKSPLGRPRLRWENNINVELQRRTRRPLLHVHMIYLTVQDFGGKI